MSEPLLVYFSLRSPYSWLALHRLDQLGERLDAKLHLVALHPRAGVDVPDPATHHARFRYLVEDVSRMADAYGLRMKPPASLDVRWEIPHAAFNFANEHGLGLAFAVAAGHARFARSQDLGSLDVLRELAEIVGLDPARTVAAAEDPIRHARLDAGLTSALQAGVIGVPFFIQGGKHFWGNDRLEWVLREMDLAAGRPASDLGGAGCFAPPWSAARS